MDVSRVSNPEESQLLIKNWVGWRVGWLTGWYNPFDRFVDVITSPVEIGRLVTLQGEFMQAQGKLVQDFGNKLSDFGKGIK